MPDEVGNVAGGRLGEVGRLDRADDGESVAIREIRPGVVVGEQLAVPRGNRGYDGFDGFVQRRDACGESVVVGAIVIGVGGIPVRQVVANYLRVAQRQDRVGPQVGVGIPVLFGKGEVELPLVAGDGLLAQADDGGAGLQVGLRHFQGGFLKEKPVEKNQVRSGEGNRHRRCGLEGVGIYAFRHHTFQGDAVPADILHDAGDWRYGGHHVEEAGSRLLGSRCRRCGLLLTGARDGYDGGQAEH